VLFFVTLNDLFERSIGNLERGDRRLEVLVRMRAQEGRGVSGECFEATLQIACLCMERRVRTPVQVPTETGVLGGLLERVIDDAKSQESVFEVLVVRLVDER
jgi:hypothetical protein